MVVATMSPKEKRRLKLLIKELKSYKALHTEYVSVYVPAGYDLNKINSHLSDELGTASNIKSSATRKNVQGALDKMLQTLKLFKKTPPNGLALFAGNIASKEGKQDMRSWYIEPTVPLNIRIYRCDKAFLTEHLEDILVDKRAYGLVVLDRRDADIALLKGKTIVHLQKTHSEVPGKTKAGGQCQMFGTLVQSSTGTIPKIEDCDTSMTVKSANFDKITIKDSQILDKWTVPKKKVYKITTKYPQLVTECSAEHVLFVLTKDGVVEKKAEDLKENDTLLMPERIDIKGKRQKLAFKKYYNSFLINEEGRSVLKKAREKKKLLQRELAVLSGMTQTAVSFYEIGKRNVSGEPLEKLCFVLELDFNKFVENYAEPFHHQGTSVVLPSELTEEFAQFLGYFIGDGCSEQDRITFFEQREEVALKYQKLFNHFFNIESSYRFRESKNYHQIRFTSRPLVRMVKGEFPEIKKTFDTVVPEKVLKSPNSIVAKFLRGFFDAEGYVNKGRKSVGIASVNKTVIGQTLFLLLRFSILASFIEYDNKKNPYSDNPIFKLNINDRDSLLNFQKFIGFSSSEKQNILTDVISRKTGKSNSRQILPLGSEVLKVIERHDHGKADFSKVSNFFYDKKMMGKAAFRDSMISEVKDEVLLSRLKEICDYPLLPVKIASIEVRDEECEMVDIAVGQENFIANGIVVHNSAQRYARIREGSYKDHFKKIADLMKDHFFNLGNNLMGIIIGGPGITVNDFMNKDYLTGDLKKKIIGTKDLSYTGEFGLQELLEKSADLLANEEVAREKEIMQKFLLRLVKQIEKAAYGKEEVEKALSMGAVETLLLSEAVSDSEVMKYEELAETGGTDVRVISTETREGVQLKNMGGYAALLRFPIN